MLANHVAAHAQEHLLSSGGTLGERAEVHVPPAALQRVVQAVARPGGARLPLLRTVVVSWSGHGPHYGAGETLGTRTALSAAARDGPKGRRDTMRGAGASIASGVLSVSFFDDDARHVNVSGLDSGVGHAIGLAIDLDHASLHDRAGSVTEEGRRW